MKNSEYKFRALIENSHDGISLLGANGKLNYVTPSTKRILGYDYEELVDTDPATFTHPEDLEDLVSLLTPLMSDFGATITTTCRIRHKNGAWRMIRSNITNMLHDPGIEALVFNFQDVTDQLLAEEQLMHANRLYAFISQINQAIVHFSDEYSVFAEACRIAIESGKFGMAWIGLFDLENKRINLVKQSGIPDEDLHLFSATYEVDGPVDHILRANSYYICNNIEKDLQLAHWKPYAAVRGIGACIALPLRKSGKIIGAFNLYAHEVDFFSREEVKLLEEVAGDISFALDIFEKEGLRKQAEEQLKHGELRLLQAQAVAHFGHWEMDFSTGIATWSEEACRIYGLSLEDNKHTFEDWISFVHPEDLAYVMRVTNASRETMSNSAFSHRIVLKDGTIKYIYGQTQFLFNDNGKPIGLYGVAHDVTEQKIAEEKLVNANRLYSFISGINQTIVHVKDEKTLFDEACRIAIDLGKFAMAWIGIPHEENNTLHIGSRCSVGDQEILNELAYPTDGATAYVLQNQVYYVINDFESETAPSDVKTFASCHGYKSNIALPIKKNGTVYAILKLFSTHTNIFDDEEIVLLEEVAGDISFSLDVFEQERLRVLAEKNIEASELRMKQAQAIAHIGNWSLDFSTGIARWSDEHCKIYGLPVDQDAHTFESWISFIHPDDLNFVTNTIKGTDSSFKGASFQHRIIRPDGAVRHINMHSQFEINAHGEPVGLYGVSHDITESKEAEESLIRSEANLRLIMDLIPQSIFVKDYNGKYVFVNKTFAALYGLSPKELISKSTMERITVEEEGARFLEQDREVMRTGVTKIIPEAHFTTPNGETRIFHTTKVPYTPARANERVVLGIANDITEQKRADAERAKIIADVVQRNKDLEQFSYIVSHNLRTHVANILGLTEVMQISALDHEEERTIIEELGRSAGSLDSVIKDLNYILQIKHKETKKKEMVRFSVLLDEIKASIDSLIKNEQVQIIGNFDECDEMVTLKGYLYSIFFNLISNSIKYRQAARKPVIEITSIRQGNRLCITFEDNGLGIDLEKRSAQVFGLYKRFHTHVDGKGMGLYMVKTQVESLGGKIAIASEVNKGTKFTIEFDIE